MFENIPKLLRTKSFWLAVIGIITPVLITIGQPEIADQLTEGAEALATEGFKDDVRWAIGFLTAIAMRLGYLKGK